MINNKLVIYFEKSIVLYKTLFIRKGKRVKKFKKFVFFRYRSIFEFIIKKFVF